VSVPRRADQRRHDAGATRRALLDAASAVFDERGFDGATTREIGERAGVDAALIARYFGHKAGLYLAVIGDERHANALRPEELNAAAVATRLLSRWDERGRTPVARALANPEPGEQVRRQLRDILDTRILGPLSAKLDAEGVDAPRLRAELLVALTLGVAVSRANGTLSELADEPLDRLLERLTPLLEALVPTRD
jgi:AcrR family transcriptional regulator